jgi:hypothetical protein
MAQVSVIRLMLAEAAFAGLLLLLIDPREDGDAKHALPTLVGSLAVGCLVLLGRKKDRGPAFRVAVALVLGMIVGSSLFAPRYGCRGYIDLREELFAALMGGLPCALGCSMYMRRDEP